MTPSAELLTDAFDRIRSVVHDATNDLTPDELAFRVDSGANSIAWLIWHLTRIHDDHLSDVMGREQLWTTEGWSRDFGLPFPASDTGFGQDRKSTRLNSSHVSISYAVFCLKK